jgi:hypothetical protein
MTDDETKDELLRELANVDDRAEQLEKAVREAGKSLRLVRDAITPFRNLLKATPAKELPRGELMRQLTIRRKPASISEPSLN